MSKSIKRLLREQHDIQAKPEPDIYFVFDETNLYTCRVLLIPHPESLYRGALLTFTMTCKDTYPMDPPHVQFTTPKGDENVRIHPNLYGGGKCCLSILGTWGANEWSPMYTRQTIMVQIRALMDENPLVHEPGHENKSLQHPDALRYIKVVQYRVLRYCVLNALIEAFSQTGNFHGKSEWVPIAVQEFLKHYEYHVSVVEQFKDLEGQVLDCFHYSIRVNYKLLVSDLQKCREQCEQFGEISK